MGTIYGFLGIVIVVVALYIWFNWAVLKGIVRGNCLVFKHPDNNPNGSAALEIEKVDYPPGPSYPLKANFFIPEKLVKWCYEEKGKDGKWKLIPFVPDEHCDYKGQGSDQLANALDWRPAKRIFRQKNKMLEKIAWGGCAVIGCASLFGIMMLLDMLGKQ